MAVVSLLMLIHYFLLSVWFMFGSCDTMQYKLIGLLSFALDLLGKREWAALLKLCYCC